MFEFVGLDETWCRRQSQLAARGGEDIPPVTADMVKEGLQVMVPAMKGGRGWRG